MTENHRNTLAATPTKQLSVVDQFRRDLEKMTPQFKYALPAHIPVERFNRVVMTAMQNNPKLYGCSRPSIFNACMKCAQDGLLPDGREAAIVPFGENEDGQKKSDQATYLPMVAGYRKKARNSGELSDLYAHVVFDGDQFDFQLGDEPYVKHKPALTRPRGAKPIAVYSIAKFKDGGTSYEVMSISEVEEIRQKFSRARKGPWNDPVTYPEMVRKTCVRRHCKSLPMSTDLDTVLHRDDELYDMQGAKERGKQVTKHQPASAMAALEKWAGSTGDSEGNPPPSADDPGDPRPGDDTVIEHTDAGDQSQAELEPTMGELIGKAQKNPPKDPETFKLLVRQMIHAAKYAGETAALANWWSGPNARAMRNGAQMTGEDTAEMSAEISAACST
jgi:recombination protein RecT